MSRKRNNEGCETNMTPMIDVVFQLIIFFIVTINISDAKDESICLELGKNGQEIDAASTDVSALVIDVNQRGRVSINDVTLNDAKLREILKNRFARMGSSFQVWIRGDARADHMMIRRVMDVCTASGIARVTFVAVKDARTTDQIKFLAKRRRR